MRSLLDDRDPSVRCIAAGVLAGHRDAASIPRLAKALEGDADAFLACKTIERWSAWKGDRLVPALIGFLEDDRFSWQYGDELGIPAVKARAGLRRMTGRWFPFDAGASGEAWRRVEAIPDRAERRKRLGEVFPDPELPLMAEMVGTVRPRPREPAAVEEAPEDGESIATVRITNGSPGPISIARLPCRVQAAWSGGCGGASPADPGGIPAAGPHVRLGPGEHLDLDVILPDGFLRDDPSTRELDLLYASRGEASGLPPPMWVGWLPVRLGPPGEEDRTDGEEDL